MMVSLALAAQTALAEAESRESTVKPFYQIQRTTVTPAFDGQWNGPAWNKVPALEVAHFYRTDLSNHRPKTQSKVLFDEKGIYIHFRVEDQYVRSVETKYHGKVWEDACVEFFVEPKPGRGYFNFEINCGGTMLLSYHENPEWKGDSLREPGAVPFELAQSVKIYHSMPKVVDPEVEEPTVWHVEYFIPFKVFEAYVGDLEGAKGQTWRANFYKCAENNSHPHWASWSLIETKLDFHQPEFFSEIRFQE
ncbi:MAG: carbohydrate-binding family 9-like protein [Candidatus Hydrogenedentes bacterium]|nr:carbohydrate-binding family 9-like protein [Candidatus Hydrogenedentota bacterium]